MWPHGPISRIGKINVRQDRHIHEASESMFKSVSDKVVTEEKERNVENGRTENHLKVSGDGSWKKRGYT